MNSTSPINIESLLEKPIWQLTAQEFCALSHHLYANDESAPPSGVVRISGVKALADYLDCCESTVFSLRRNGILEEAIISQIGRKIVFDGEKARALAAEYQREQRAHR